MSDATSPEATWEILASWARRADLLLPIADEGVVHGWADMEIGYDVRRDASFGYAVAWWNRGHATTVARFAAQVAADRLLLLMMGTDWRRAQGLWPTGPAELAPGAELVRGEDGWALTWAGATAVFTSGLTARRYSAIAGLSLARLSERIADPASGL